MENQIRTTVGFSRTRIDILSSSESIITHLRDVFSMMPGDSNLEPSDTIGIRASTGGFLVSGGGFPEGTIRSRSRAAKDARLRVIQAFAHARSDLIWIHSGSVQRGGSAILVAGAWASGKSSVVRGLCEHGYEYMSDDIAALDTGSRLIHSFPVAPANRESSLDTVNKDAVGKLKKMPWKPKTFASSGQGYPIHCLIFPQFQARPPEPEARRITPAEAAVRLLEQCFLLDDGGGPRLGEITTLIQPLPAYVVSYSDWQTTATMISKLDP